VIYRYGIIWLTWLLVNRFLCEHLLMADAVLNFAQIAGTLGGFDLGWPTGIRTFLRLCGVLDFDIDVTGPGCIVSWTWAHDLALQLSLPLAVGLINALEFAVHSILRRAQDDPDTSKLRRAKVIAKTSAFISCLYMTLVRYTVAAFVCIQISSTGLKVRRIFLSVCTFWDSLSLEPLAHMLGHTQQVRARLGCRIAGAKGRSEH
jgi:hypothetical protein